MTRAFGMPGISRLAAAVAGAVLLPLSIAAPVRAAPPGSLTATGGGLALQTAWDADLDHDAYVRAVEVLLEALA